jgi:hypothetical protein
VPRVVSVSTEFVPNETFGIVARQSGNPGSERNKVPSQQRPASEQCQLPVKRGQSKQEEDR